MLHDLLHEPIETGLDTPEACLNRALTAGEFYRSLDRPGTGAEHLLELKFASLHWRHRLLIRLGESPWLGSHHNTLVGIVDALGTRLPGSLVADFSERLDTRTIDHLLALQGVPPRRYPEFRALAGPGTTLNIRANRSSSWPFQRWKTKPDFQVYHYEQDGVRFRGTLFRPGDVLLANVNINGNGVYTVLSDPTRFSSHAAVFAILEDESGRYPAVIETYEQGVRAVPLSVFLGERFCAYVEVYRHRRLKLSHCEAINRSALKMLESAKGYNFDSVSDDREYVSCCSVARLLHMDAGLEPATWKSRIADPRIQANLEKLGYTFFDFFAPVDYPLDPNFVCVGWVDNHQFHDLLARELVENRFRRLFMTRNLNTRGFHFMGRINQWAVGQIRRQTLPGRTIGRLTGFDDASLPRGPDELLGVITLVEAQLGRAIARTRKWIQTLDYPSGCFSFFEFNQRTDVQRHLESNLNPGWLE